MVKLIFLSYLCFLINVALAQDSTSYKLLIRDDLTINASHPLYVIDNAISLKTFQDLNPNDILSVSVLKDKEAETIYGSRATNGALVITTKKYAIDNYQKNFSSHSAKYKKYLDAHHGKDNDCGYVLNGTYITGKDSSEIITKLYEISSEKIRMINFIDNDFRNGNKIKELVIITTKK
ncbi:hypothetical protein [Mucilaginibacter sp.]|uniref:hypothetical protein n=1 Tax=Mucilaginibacter sp. TaxID=1882438 RepID=UPI003D0DF82E